VRQVEPVLQEIFHEVFDGHHLADVQPALQFVFAPDSQFNRGSVQHEGAVTGREVVHSERNAFLVCEPGVGEAFFGRRSLRRVLLQHFFNQIVGGRRHLHQAFVEQVRLHVGNLAYQQRNIFLIEGLLSSEHHVENHPRRPNVHFLIVDLTRKYFRGREGHCSCFSHHLKGLGGVGLLG